MVMAVVMGGGIAAVAVIITDGVEVGTSLRFATPPPLISSSKRPLQLAA
jgi:hypothetical protein